MAATGVRPAARAGTAATRLAFGEGGREERPGEAVGVVLHHLVREETDPDDGHVDRVDGGRRFVGDGLLVGPATSEATMGDGEPGG